MPFSSFYLLFTHGWPSTNKESHARDCQSRVEPILFVSNLTMCVNVILFSVIAFSIL